MDEREPKASELKTSGPRTSGTKTSEPKISQHDPGGRTGADSAPIAADDPVVAPGADQTEASADPAAESSHVVYSENEQEVAKGFAIALRAMGLG